MNNGVNFTYTKGLTTNCLFLRDKIFCKRFEWTWSK